MREDDVANTNPPALRPSRSILHGFPNGRILLSLGFKGSWVAYLVAPNSGFIMQYDDPGTMVLSGFFEQQSDGLYTTATLNGEDFGGAVDPGMSGVGYGNGVQNWNGNGAWSGAGNVAAPGSVIYPDMPVSGTYAITDSSLGSGNWLGDGNYHKKFYAISPNKIISFRRSCRMFILHWRYSRNKDRRAKPLFCPRRGVKVP